MAYSEREFFDKIKPYVIADMHKSNILASLSAAQASLESRQGNSGLTQKANNLFGIKGKYNGQSVNMLTTERINGQNVKVYADFRKYPSWQESINDHSDFLLKYKRYKSIIGEKNYITACRKMADSGYATADSNGYYDSLVAIIQRNKLYEWDSIEGVPVEENPKPIYKENSTYTTKVNLYVRDSAAGNKIKFDALTENGKVHGHFDDYGYAILEKGTRVTCFEVDYLENSTWLRIPSGWICAIEEGKVYIE